MKFQPGNQEAAKSKRFMGALNRAIAADNGKRLRGAADQLLDKAAEGEPWAIGMLADRLDGKPTTVVEGPEGESLFSGITVKFIKPDD